MKNLLLFLSLLACTSVFAQNISKEEKQALLEEIKELKKSPEKLKYLKESIEVRDITLGQLNEEISELKIDAQKKDLVLEKLEDSLVTMREEMKTMEVKKVPVANNYNLPSTTTNAPLDHSGYKYRVQIGVFKNFDITNLFDEPKYIVHEYVNGMHRYSIGNFTSEMDAEAFKKEMKRMGLKDAFVTTYEEGYRLGDPRPAVKNTVAPLDQPAPEPEVQVERNGFNVKPSAKVVTPSFNSIESNPYGDLNGKVISTSPVKIDTKNLNDKMNSNTAPKSTTTATPTNVAPTTTTTPPAQSTTTTTTTTTVGSQKVENRETEIVEPKEDVKVGSDNQEFLFRDNNSNNKSSGIKINVGN